MANCTVDNCDGISRCLKMCRKHYTRFRRHGTTDSLIGHPSEIEVDGDTAKIKLCGGLVALIDADDVPLVQDHKWTWSASNGVMRNVWISGCNTNRHVKLHRQILNPPRHMVVDHINGDKLDNRRSNLRVVEQWQNMVNTRSRPSRNIERTSTGWFVRMRANGKRHNIGHFHKYEDAVVARDVAAKSIHGDLRKR